MHVFGWLAVPLSGAEQHHLPLWMAWHGRMMVFAWAILLPLGVLVARYFKVTPRQAWPDQLDNKAWWHWHRVLQTTGVLIMTCGGLLASGHGHDVAPLAEIHRYMGWGLVASGWIQVFGGALRGSKGGELVAGPGGSGPRRHGDHYDMTVRRQLFEYIHKILGTVAVLVAVATIGIGLMLADAPRWMPVVLGLWWLALAILAIRWQREGRCIDTYQAIWGPDPVHPGNRIRPIGWGVSRYSRETWSRRIARKNSRR